MGTTRYVSIKISTEVWDQLAQQARAFGYTGGTVVFYCSDRLAQLSAFSTELLGQILPPPTPSWPPRSPTPSPGQPSQRRWFLKDGDQSHFTRRGKSRGRPRRARV